MGDAADDAYRSMERDEATAQDYAAAVAALDDAILNELLHLPLPGAELRMAAMQVRAMLLRDGYVNIEF